MVHYVGEAADAIAAWDKTGVLLVNLGSPEAPTAEALRPYLKEFLWDPRVVEVPRLQWWLILNGIILNTRPAKSAEAYQAVWTDEGAPLQSISRRQLAAVKEELGRRFDEPPYVALAMRYGQPSIEKGLTLLKRQGVGRVLVLPLYAQYSASTVASVHDEVFNVLQRWRRIPEIRTINEYYRQESYIDALANSVRDHWQANEPGERLLFSFHGIPKRYLDNGDPYYYQCMATAEAVAQRLELDQRRWFVSFQSRFGKEEWLQPYTDATLTDWAKSGVKSVDVICPGFAADCLETIEEIDVENRGYFLENGGERYHYIPALNDREDHIKALCDVIEPQLQGWLI